MTQFCLTGLLSLPGIDYGAQANLLFKAQLVSLRMSTSPQNRVPVGWVLLCVGCCWVGVGLLGCTSSEVSDTPQAPIDSATQEAAVSGEGPATFTGQVTFLGEVPPPYKISVTKDVEVCGVAGVEQRDIQLGADQGLQNAVVEIVGVAEPDGGWNWDAPEDGYVLRQKGCQFQPFLTVLPNGAELKIYNDDPVGHNVNTPSFNELQAGGGEPVVKTIDSRAPIRVQCNVHSWMQAWLFTVDSPYYAVTDADGKFEISDIPPGKYRVNVWHPAGIKPPRLRMQFDPGAVVTETIAIEP
ncbi:MAG TPA: hypothetical protein DCY79_11695 [Planctomycetaceae bacterium]|nr:hypothetical protein [Blastopirellula sp.]HAY80462.1 hypothetical protein [Planctomycetaceae bacterium]